MAAVNKGVRLPVEPGPLRRLRRRSRSRRRRRRRARHPQFPQLHRRLRQFHLRVDQLALQQLGPRDGVARQVLAGRLSFKRRVVLLAERPRGEHGTYRGRSWSSRARPRAPSPYPTATQLVPSRAPRRARHHQAFSSASTSRVLASTSSRSNASLSINPCASSLTFCASRRPCSSTAWASRVFASTKSRSKLSTSGQGRRRSTTNSTVGAPLSSALERPSPSRPSPSSPPRR